MDLVVTVPKNLWFEWIAEGDAVGEPVTGTEWGFFLSRQKPPISAGERLYVVAWGMVRGYAPVTRLVNTASDNVPIVGRWVICREGCAVACTISGTIEGFRGFRKRTWEREGELPFPNWKTAGLPRIEIERALRRGLLKREDAEQALERIAVDERRALNPNPNG